MLLSLDSLMDNNAVVVLLWSAEASKKVKRRLHFEMLCAMLCWASYMKRWHAPPPQWAPPLLWFPTERVEEVQGQG